VQGRLNTNADTNRLPTTPLQRIVKSGIDKNLPAVNEAKQINKSISALGNVIKALANNSSLRSDSTDVSHVPFRDSKLTRILTETLSGKAACVLIANLSNSIDDAEENMMTLKFAERAMSIATKPVKFESVVKTQPKNAKKDRSRNQGEDHNIWYIPVARVA